MRGLPHCGESVMRRHGWRHYSLEKISVRKDWTWSSSWGYWKLLAPHHQSPRSHRAWWEPGFPLSMVLWWQRKKKNWKRNKLLRLCELVQGMNFITGCFILFCYSIFKVPESSYAVPVGPNPLAQDPPASASLVTGTHRRLTQHLAKEWTVNIPKNLINEKNQEAPSSVSADVFFFFFNTISLLIL